jgi:DNA-binding NtrC family response regulator
MHGYRVLAAGDGEQAVEMFSQYEGTVDLLLTDVILPGMNGKVLSEKLTGMTPELRTVYMSGYPANVISSVALQEEGGAFIQKPFTRAALLEKICKALAERNSGDV